MIANFYNPSLQFKIFPTSVKGRHAVKPAARCNLCYCKAVIFLVGQHSLYIYHAYRINIMPYIHSDVKRKSRL